MSERSSILTIALDHAWPPFSFTDDRGGAEGLLVELWRDVGASAGIDVRFELGDWCESLDYIRNGRADLHGGMMRSKQRDRRFSFSAGLIEVSGCLFVSRHGGEAPNSLHEAVERDWLLGVTEASYEREYLLSVEPRVRTKAFANNQTLVRAAMSGAVDAFVADYPVATYLIEHEPRGSSWKSIDQLYTCFIRAAVLHERRSVLTRINATIESLPAERIERIDSLVSTARDRDIQRLNREIDRLRFVLDERDRQLNDIAANLPGFVYRVKNDDKWTALNISKGCEHLTGYSPHEFLDGPQICLGDLILPEYAEYLRRSVAEAMDRNDIFDVEYEIRDRDGVVRWVLERGRAVLDAHGTVRFIEGLVVDITERKRSEMQQRDSARFQQLLTEISSEFVKATVRTFQEKAKVALTRLSTEIGIERCWIKLFESPLAEEPITITGFHIGEPPPSDLVERTVRTLADGEVYARGRAEKMVNYPEGICDYCDSVRIESLIWLPLRAEGQQFGMIGFEQIAADAPRVGLYETDGSGHTPLLRLIANIVTDALSRNLLEVELHRRSVTDPLTGVYNRRYFIEQLRVAIEEYRREAREFAVAMLDLDWFKQLNDTFGHVLGDEVLKMFVQTIASTVRPCDIVARYGGEEFLILLRNATRAQSLQITNRILDRVRASSLAAEQGTIRYTVSCGIASVMDRLPDDALDRENDGRDLLEIADRRLYLAKARGRDRVVSAD